MASGVFINNAGMFTDHPMLLHQHSNHTLDNVIALNCVALVKATHAVLPGMLARGKGAIVNISSGSADCSAAPYLSVYAATKKFVDHFSGSVAEEYRSKGIYIQVCSCYALVDVVL